MQKLLTADQVKELDYMKTFVEQANEDIIAAEANGQRAIHFFTQSKTEAFNLVHLFDANGYHSRAIKIVHEKTPYNWIEEYKIEVSWV